MKINVAVFFGGASVEHEVSVISAVQAMRSMDRNKYEVLPIYITKEGELFYGPKLTDISLYRDLTALRKNTCSVLLERKNKEVLLLDAQPGLFRKKALARIDVAFPIMHGTNGEDGTIQGFLELLRLPYVGCDVVSSALGMDKVYSKHVLAQAGVPVLPCVSFSAREFVEKKDRLMAKIADQIGYPVILKPANLGSSVGISKVSGPQDMEEAVSLASSFAGRLMVERAVVNLKEINCSVLGDATEAQASVCEEPVMSDEILSYADKYMSKSSSKGMSSLKRRLPADLTPEKSKEIQQLALRAFRVLGCSGVVRVDFLMDRNDGDRVYVNELNTIPGSLAFYLWEADGMAYSTLIDRLISQGFARDRTRKNLMYTFDSNILDMAGGFGAKGGAGKA